MNRPYSRFFQRHTGVPATIVAAHDAQVEKTDGIDRYCSSSRWMLPAYAAFGDSNDTVFMDLVGGSALFQVVQIASGLRALLPLEATWQLGSPLAAHDPAEAMRSFFETLANESHEWDLVLLSGIMPATALKHAFRRECVRAQLPLSRLRPSERDILVLKEGVDSWLNARSSGFRAKLRRAERRCEAAGIAFVPLTPSGRDEGAACFDRLLAIEEKSWKGAEDTGILSEPMRTFTRLVLLGAAERKELHVLIARDNDEDVGFVYGSCFSNSYRGLQMTYAARCSALSLGNVLQLRMIQWMTRLGCLEYDLGSALPYKARWSDIRERTESYILGHARADASYF